MKIKLNDSVKSHNRTTYMLKSNTTKHW